MLSSKGEIKIHEILEGAGINFIEEYTFPNLKSNRGNPLRFDFAVFDDDGNLDFLIEYNGAQHYEARSKFGGKAGLTRQQFNDMKKREYCRNHNIPLLIIPYYDEPKLNYDYILQAVHPDW